MAATPPSSSAEAEASRWGLAQITGALRAVGGAWRAASGDGVHLDNNQVVRASPYWGQQVFSQPRLVALAAAGAVGGALLLAWALRRRRRQLTRTGEERTDLENGAQGNTVTPGGEAYGHSVPAELPTTLRPPIETRCSPIKFGNSNTLT